MTFEIEVRVDEQWVPGVSFVIEGPTFYLARAAFCARERIEPDDVRLAEPRRYA